nr:transcription repressor OFP7-like [Ipomoea batatas]GMC56091.1 transcription repressor OFP7-like [Ipomoea batatas]
MGRGLKLRFLMPSFQFCRSKKPSFLASIHMFSPINPKAFDTPYPGFPVPPPSTPTQYHEHLESPVHRFKNEQKPCHKTYNSPVSGFSDENMRPIARSNGKKKAKLGRDQRAKAKHRLSRSNNSSGESGWFSGEETESLFSSSPSFDSSLDLDYQTNGIATRKQKNGLKVRTLKHYLSGSFKDTENDCAVKKSVFERLMPCMVEGVVKDSFAVVKKTDDPYEDFKISMLEMIVEEQIFAVKDLEQLLLCFLSLNSQHHHAAIVEAFTEIWYELFTISPVPGTNWHGTHQHHKIQ